MDEKKSVVSGSTTDSIVTITVKGVNTSSFYSSLQRAVFPFTFSLENNRVILCELVTHLKNSAGKINPKNFPIIFTFLNNIYIFHVRYQTPGTQAQDIY